MQTIFIQAWYVFAPRSSVDLKLYCCYSTTLIAKYVDCENTSVSEIISSGKWQRNL